MVHFSSNFLRQFFERSIKIALIICCVASLPQVTNAQQFNLKISKIDTYFGAEKLPSYQTVFHFEEGFVQKAWWRYIRKIAYIKNKQSHYENKILAKRSQAEEDIFCLSLVQFEGGYSTLSLALDKKQSGGANAKNYNDYLKALLLDFKIKFYTSYLQELIANQEKEELRLGSKVDKLERTKEKLENSKNKKNASPKKIEKDMAQIDGEVEKYRVALFARQKELDRLKRELKKIR